MPIITHQLPKVPQLISPAVYHKAFRASIEDAHALMVAFSYLHNANSYAKLLVVTHKTPPGMTVTTATSTSSGTFAPGSKSTTTHATASLSSISAETKSLCSTR